MTPGQMEASAWADAALAAALFAIDPPGLGGVVLRGPPGPIRDTWLAMTCALLDPAAPVKRVPPHIGDDRLLGGLDLATSLAVKKPVIMKGLLAACDGGVVILPLAERMDLALSARLAGVLDNRQITLERDGLACRLPARLGVIALDEGMTPDERPPPALCERLAFDIALTALGGRGSYSTRYDAPSVARARASLAGCEAADDATLEALCEAASMLGVQSARPVLMAVRAARANAALDGRTKIDARDAAVGARLVLAPRASSAPESGPHDAAPEPADPADPPPAESSADAEGFEHAAKSSETERVVAAIRAALPEDLLARVAFNDRFGKGPQGRRGRGAAARSAHGGRPIGSRPGEPGSGQVLSLIDTLRAAAPWQALRTGGDQGARLQVRRDDFRIRRYVRRTRSTTIFVVDASGSTAFQRLAEAKGAVELLLAKAYVSRANVALIAFRGVGAEVLLPPTRSLTRARNRLADLPGGGGTPLAAGIEAAIVMAQAERARDQMPLIVFLTDGRANVARDGRGGRDAAESDAISACHQLRQSAIAAVFIDSSPRPRSDGDRFARAMGAVYAPLPLVDAGAMLGIVDNVRATRA